MCVCNHYITQQTLTAPLFIRLPAANNIGFIREMYGLDVKTKDRNKFSSASKNANVILKKTNLVFCPFTGVMITKCVLRL